MLLGVGSTMRGGTAAPVAAAGSLLLTPPKQQQRAVELQTMQGAISPRQIAAVSISPQAQQIPPAVSVVPVLPTATASATIHHQGQMSPPPAVSPNLQKGVTSVSASGRTIHHHGQSPTRGGILPPLVTNPAQHPLSSHLNMSSQQLKSLTPQQQQQLQAAIQAQQQGSGGGTAGAGLQVQVPTQSQAVAGRRSSGSHSPGAATAGRQFERTSPILSQFSTVLPMRTSPKHSPERPRKKIKLEEKPPATSEIAQYRKLVCDEKLREMASIKESYREHLIELFFLQSGMNLMDYHTWKRKPGPALITFLKSGSSNLDSDDDEIGQEMKINDEVAMLSIDSVLSLHISTSYYASIYLLLNNISNKGNVL